MWDVVIVGAGPAGAAAALGALRRRPDAAVLLLDAATFPRDKVCGDGVAPQALDVLAALGVDPDPLVEGTAPVPRLRLQSPGGVLAVRDFTRPARVVPRAWFDQRLLRAALSAGARLQTRRVRHVDVRTDRVVVDGQLHARTVIGADGAESVVRRVIAGRPRRGTVALALRGYAPAAGYDPSEQVLAMSRTGWPAYAWAFPVGDGRVNVGYGEVLTGRPPTRAHLRDRLGELLPGVELATELRGHRLPLSTGRPRFAHGRVLLAGDAASLINPLTGEGIYYAVRSGSLAGASAVSGDPAAQYRQAMHRALGPHLRQSDVVGRLASRPWLVDVATAAGARDQGLFDALTDFGLADGRLGVHDLVKLGRSGLGRLGLGRSSAGRRSG